MNDRQGIASGKGPRADSEHRTDPETEANTLPQGSAKLSDFEILREIGRGGTSIVYEALQTSLRRKVALKRLPAAAMFDQRWLERFQNEVRAAAQLNHPNIVAFFEVGHDEGAPFYAMQLVDGISLAQLIQCLRQCRESVGDAARPCKSLQGDQRHPAFLRVCERCRCPLANSAPSSDPAAPVGGDDCDVLRSDGYYRLVAQLIIDAARALDYAHEQGILHLDVKPSNLLIDREGKTWLTDFGASHFGSGNDSSAARGRAGTLSYMSPEQLFGGVEPLDRRSDVYSLGATLCELLTLKRPSLDRGRQASAIRRLNPAVPRTLVAVVLRATAEAPDGRYATAAELANDLQRFLESEPLAAQPPDRLAQVHDWTTQHRLLTSIGVTALLAVVALAIGLGPFRNSEQQDERTPNLDTQQRVSRDQNLDAVRAADSQATVLASQGKLDEALRLMRQAHAGYRDMLGSDDPETIDCALKVAKLLQVSSQLPEAERLLRESWDTVRRTHGEQHLQTITVGLVLSRQLREQGDYDAAEKIAREIYAAAQKLPGSEQTLRGEAVIQLSLALHAQRRFDEADAIESKAMGTIMGKEETVADSELLAAVFTDSDKLEQAEQWGRQALDIKRADPSQHAPLSVATTLYGLGRVLVQMGKLEEAQQLLRECQTIRRTALPERHGLIAETESLLSECRAKRGEHADAKPAGPAGK